MKPTTDIFYREVAIVLELLDASIHNTQELQDHIWTKEGDYYSHLEVIENDVIKKKEIVSAFSVAKKNLVEKGLIKESIQKSTTKQGRGTDTVKCYQLDTDKFINVYDLLVPDFKNNPLLYTWILERFLYSKFFDQEIIGIYKESQTQLLLDRRLITTDDNGRVVPALDDDIKPLIQLDKALLAIIKISPSVLYYFLKNLNEIYQINKETKEKYKNSGDFPASEIHTLYLKTVMNRLYDDELHGYLLKNVGDIDKIQHPFDVNDVSYVIFTDLKDLGIKDDIHIETIITRVVWADKRYKNKIPEIDNIMGNRYFKELISPFKYYLQDDDCPRGVIPLDEMFREWYHRQVEAKKLPKGYHIQLVYANPKDLRDDGRDWEKFLHKEKPQKANKK